MTNTATDRGDSASRGLLQINFGRFDEVLRPLREELARSHIGVEGCAAYQAIDSIRRAIQFGLKGVQLEGMEMQLQGDNLRLKLTLGLNWLGLEEASSAPHKTLTVISDSLKGLDRVADLRKINMISESGQIGVELEFTLNKEEPQLQIDGNTPLANFEFSVRTRSCLRKMGIDTVAKLMAHTPEELIGAPNFGENSLKEVRATLKRVGGRLRNDFDAE